MNATFAARSTELWGQGSTAVIAYGKGREIASNRHEEQEMFVLCLRNLPSALV
ncbi:hypothetical protein [Streptomyces sp. NPDC048411]|uniref:hypothetical protein n=1 Tax=Streptomyces sp. NPDC048411 TaxID=3157206 RepID=UPI0034522CDD